VDVVGDDAVSCKNSGFVERNLGTKTFFCQVLTQSRFPHDREVDNAGNGHRPADILLKEWAGRRDLAVDLTIVHPNPGACRPLRSSAANSLKDKGEQKSGRAPTPAGGWAWTSPPWCSTPGGGASKGKGRWWGRRCSPDATPRSSAYNGAARWPFSWSP